MPINQFSNVMYSWQPAGVSRPNTFTAQNIFKAASTTVPAFVAQATGTISAVPTLDANGIALFQGTEAVAGHVFFSASAATTHVVFRRNNGTYASPTAIANADVLGSLQWQGRGASTFGTVPAAQIRGVAQQAFTETARGTALEFYVTALNTITQQLTLTISPTLVFAPVDMSATGFTMSKTAGAARLLSFQTSSSNRWVVQANATAEGGSNAGSDFEIRRYSDAGADLGLVMAVTRSTGDINFGGGGGYIYARNNLYVDSTCFINGASGVSKTISFRTALGRRWEFFCNNTAESSTATGSDFEFRRSDNSGVDLGLVMAVTRSNGNITFNGGGGITSFAANKIQITTAQTPATSAAAGNAGDIAWDDTYLYVRMSTGWRRIALGAAF